MYFLNLGVKGLKASLNYDFLRTTIVSIIRDFQTLAIKKGAEET